MKEVTLLLNYKGYLELAEFFKGLGIKFDERVVNGKYGVDFKHQEIFIQDISEAFEFDTQDKTSVDIRINFVVEIDEDDEWAKTYLANCSNYGGIIGEGDFEHITVETLFKWILAESKRTDRYEVCELLWSPYYPDKASPYDYERSDVYAPIGWFSNPDGTSKEDAIESVISSLVDWLNATDDGY